MRLLSCLVVAPLLVGCVGGLDVGQSSDPVIISNFFSFTRLAGNHLEATALANEQLTTSTAQITTNGYELNPASAGGLLASSDGREVLTYIVSCALPAGTTLVAPDGTTFAGQLGLAPSWIDHPLNLDEQQWVSACLYARVNGFGVAVEISLRSGHPQFFASSSTEATDFTKQEGAFYGQYFDPGALQAYACSGVDNAAAIADARECAAPDPARPGLTKCGLTYTGPCGTGGHGRAAQGACQNFVGHGYYSVCSGQTAVTQATTGGGGASDSFSQVITSYVQ